MCQKVVVVEQVVCGLPTVSGMVMIILLPEPKAMLGIVIGCEVVQVRVVVCGQPGSIKPPETAVDEQCCAAL